MTDPTGQRGGTPWYVTVTDGLLFVIDTLVVTVVIGGLVGLVAGGTQHPLYELTIGYIYGLVTTPGVTGLEIVVYLALTLAVTGPVWHSRLRSRYVAATDEGTTREFEFGRETESQPTTDGVGVRPYSDGGTRRPNDPSRGSSSEWVSTVFNEPPSDAPGLHGDFYRSPEPASRPSQAEPSAAMPTTDEPGDGDVEEAAAPEPAPPEPDELADTTPDPTERLTETLDASRRRIDAVSANVPDTTDPGTMEARFEAIRSDAADSVGDLEDAFPSSQGTLERDINRLREGERDLDASITSALNQ